MNNIKSFYNYIREDSNLLIMKYIRNEVVDGYGKKVLDLIRNYAKSKKYKFLTLNFYKSNKIAEKLYRNYGFIEDEYQREDSPVINLRMKI